MSLTEDGKIFENPNDTEDLLKDHLLSQLNDKELEIVKKLHLSTVNYPDVSTERT